MSKKGIIKRLREVGVIYREPVKLTSGMVSAFYCDIKKAYGYPDILKSLADEVGKKIPKAITCIVAFGYGGVPLASLIASRFSKKLVMIRETPKNHGKGGVIDGYIPKRKDRAVVMDDVLTTGGSIKMALARLKKTRVKVVSAIVVVKRGEAKLPIPYSCIFTIDEIKNSET